jgi:hypothetical protein
MTPETRTTARLEHACLTFTGVFIVGTVEKLGEEKLKSL